MSCSHCGGCGKCSQPMNHTEKEILERLAQSAFLPIARFLLQSIQNEQLSFVMSAPVYLPSLHTNDAERKAYGTALLSLQKRHYITLDYDIPLQGFDYDEWKQSDFYQSFAFSVEAPDVEPRIEGGSAALTLQGQQVIDEVEFGG